MTFRVDPEALGRAATRLDDAGEAVATIPPLPPTHLDYSTRSMDEAIPLLERLTSDVGVDLTRLGSDLAFFLRQVVDVDLRVGIGMDAIGHQRFDNPEYRS